MSPEPFRILVVANKTWECEPLVQVLLSKDGRPSTLDGFLRGYDPAERKPDAPSAPPLSQVRGNPPIRPRLRFSAPPDALVEVWCIEDWMRTTPPLTSSSSSEKFAFTLPKIRELAFDGHLPSFVIAFGTAGVPSSETLNGCVTIGSRVYIHDAWKGAKPEEIDDQEKRFGPLLVKEVQQWLDRPLECPCLSPVLFVKQINVDSRYAAEARFLTAPIQPAKPPRILAGQGFSALGTINISDYDDYVWSDEETIKVFDLPVRRREIGSMETTHALIRLTWPELPFLFVSGLTDRVPMFNMEVSPRVYSQNFVAAHNAGAALAQLIPELARLNKSGTLIDASRPTFQVGPPVTAT